MKGDNSQVFILKDSLIRSFPIYQTPAISPLNLIAAEMNLAIFDNVYYCLLASQHYQSSELFDKIYRLYKPDIQARNNIMILSAAYTSVLFITFVLFSGDIIMPTHLNVQTMQY